MQEFTASFEYKAEVTGDSSPTLRLPPTWEPMHALDGAFTETQYIYAPTVAAALDTTPEPRILSVGLGLGYNEILIACEALVKNKPKVHIDSYESVDALRIFFRDWILQPDAIPEDIARIYNQILGLYCEKYDLKSKSVTDFLKSLLQNHQLQLLGAISAETAFTPSQGILFDAFSSKSSPELWTEEFLKLFLKKACADHCYLSTYASKGTLHRSLKLHGFTTEKKPGFGAKRESTFAQRQTLQN